MYPQNITVRLKFLLMIYANCGATAVIASTTYKPVLDCTIVEACMAFFHDV